MTDGTAGRPYPPRHLFVAQQRRRRREQYRRTGYPRERWPAADEQAARSTTGEPTVVTTVESHIPRVRFRLTALSGEERGEFVELRAGRLRVGRDQNCEIRLTDTSVSHFHAVITVGEQEITIEDLGSTNHTFVNDELVEYPRDLAHGDKIKLGHVTLLLQEESPNPGGP